MAKIEKPRQLLTDDFPEEEKEQIQKLADIINPALEGLYSVVNNGVDFSNLSWGIVSGLVVQVTESGVPDMSLGASRVTNKFKNTARKTPVGLQVVSAQCLDEPGLLTTGTPFIQYTLGDNNLIEIRNIQGLPAKKRFQLTVIIYTN